MREVVIAGTGMTAFGRFLERSVKSPVAEAVTEMLADASVPPECVEMAYFSNVLGGLMQRQESTRGQIWFEHSGLQGVPTINVENACASGSTALPSA